MCARGFFLGISSQLSSKINDFYSVPTDSSHFASITYVAAQDVFLITTQFLQPDFTKLAASCCVAPFFAQPELLRAPL